MRANAVKLLPFLAALAGCSTDASDSAGSASLGSDEEVRSSVPDDGGGSQGGSSTNGAGGGDSQGGSSTNGASGGDSQGGSSTNGASGGDSGSSASPGGAAAGGARTSGAVSGETPDFCSLNGDTLAMGAAIFGDSGTEWYESSATAPNDVDWRYGYLYASADPHDDLEGYEWIVNFRLDTAEAAGASIPTVTLYRMLNVGTEHGHGGSEAQVVQHMLTDPAAVSDYLDDLIVTLQILEKRSTPTLLHVEPDSWGFMMWAFDGVDGQQGNGDASAIEVSLAGANHQDLEGQSFTDDASGLAQAMLHLRNEYAPDVRMGFHASNFRVGTKPEVVTSFYATLGDWDVIITEPPHMNGTGSESWDRSDADNGANLNWLATVSEGTGLPIVIWQTYVEDADGYLGAWPQNQANLTAFAENGVVAVLWDPNAVDGSCDYSCTGADNLRDDLSRYSAAPLALPVSNVCWD